MNSHLPIEILELCIDQVGSSDTRTLAACALTCRALRSLSQSKIFRSVSLVKSKPSRTRILPLTYEKYRCQAFLKLLDTNPNLCRYIRRLDIVSWAPSCLDSIASIMDRLSFVELHIVPLKGWLDWESIITLSNLQESLSRAFQRIERLEVAYLLGIPSVIFATCPNLQHLRMTNCQLSEPPPPDFNGESSASTYRARIKGLNLGGTDTTALAPLLVDGSLPIDPSGIEDLIIGVPGDSQGLQLLQYTSLCSESLRNLRCYVVAGSMNLHGSHVLPSTLHCPFLETIHLTGDHGENYSMIPWAAGVLDATKDCYAIRKIIIETTTFGTFENIENRHFEPWTRLAEVLLHPTFSQAKVQVIFTNFHIKIIKDLYDAFKQEMESFVEARLSALRQEGRLEVIHRLIGYAEAGIVRT